MKKALTILLVIALGRVCIQAERIIELENPNFEQGLSGWNNKLDNKMSMAVGDAAHEGELGIRVNDDSAAKGSSLYSNKFRVAAGKVYQLRFWARAVSGDGVGVYMVFYDSQGKSLMETKEQETKNNLTPISVPGTQLTWKEFLVRKTAPEGSVEAQVWIHSYSSNQSVSDFDDFHIVELD